MPRKNTNVPSNSIVAPSKKVYSLRDIGVSQSLFTGFMQCRQRFIYQINRWVKDKGGRTTGFGSITHEMLDRIYSYWMRRRRLPNPKLIGKWLDQYVEKNRMDFAGKTDNELECDKAVIHVLLKHYINYYSEDFTEKKWLSLEEMFAVNFDGWLLRGKKDGRFESNAGTTWLLETKTMSRINEDLLLDVLDLNFQNLFYITADELQYKQPISGVLYNIIRNPGHRGTDPVTLANKVDESVTKRPEHFFIRIEAVYPKADKLNFKKNLRWWMQECEDLLDGKLPITKNYTNCSTKWPCDFIKACTSGRMVGFKQQETLFPEL
jgi:hypothetical protein